MADPEEAASQSLQLPQSIRHHDSRLPLGPDGTQCEVNTAASSHETSGENGALLLQPHPA